MAKIDFLTPPGRLVGGSVYKPKDKDAAGKPLVYKRGPKAGQPRNEWYTPIAIPKTGEPHWARTSWGEIIWEVGHRLAPNLAQSPAFAWKITDGDSTVPNKKNRKPCDQPGYPGHWILHFSNGFPPSLFNRDGTQVLTQPDAIKPGYYIQIFGSIDFNDSDDSPGLYLNSNMISLQGFGDVITVGPDGASVGFGAAPLPQGASAVPAAAFNPAPPATYVPAFPGATAQINAALVAPPVPATPSPAVAFPQWNLGSGPAAPVPQVAVAPVPQVAVAPVPNFGAVPAAPPARQMTAKANGATYEQLLANGWTDALLVQHGLMAG